LANLPLASFEDCLPPALALGWARFGEGNPHALMAMGVSCLEKGASAGHQSGTNVANVSAAASGVWGTGLRIARTLALTGL
jgi:hypothetical protein